VGSRMLRTARMQVIRMQANDTSLRTRANRDCCIDNQDTVDALRLSTLPIWTHAALVGWISPQGASTNSFKASELPE
jgi:hypothetical protein